MNLRYPAFIVFAMVTLLVRSQAPSFIFFGSVTPVDRSSYKHIIEAVKNVDPTAEVFHSDDMTILQVRSTSNMGEAFYRSAIETTGVQLLPGTRTAEELGLNHVDPNGPPVFVVTGDAAADKARYEAAVAQWNIAHPDQPIGTAIHLRNGQ